ncbi:GNAT family N-acetyltransferase [Vibrio profundum]|uniref:GNAT family N-acetyltransferase n=1 Tax=Vibrio profundum TaxID=2910247 RepID=UPI003D11BF18
MSKLRIELLDPIKTPLISRLYKAHYPSGKAKKNEDIVVGYLDSEIVAVARLRTIAPYRLLTGMLVVPYIQKSGYGHQLLNHCQAHLLKDGDFCFAYSHLESFYAQHQFKTTDPEKLPAPLLSLYRRYSQAGKQLTAMRFLAKPSPHQAVC